jgi:hypothetical protein
LTVGSDTVTTESKSTVIFIATNWIEDVKIATFKSVHIVVVSAIWCAHKELLAVIGIGEYSSR